MRSSRLTDPTFSHMTQDAPVFKIKHVDFSLIVVHAMTPDMAQFKQQFESHVAQAPDFFFATPVVLGLEAIADSEATVNFSDLIDFMRRLGMALAGVLGGSEGQRRAALDNGLGVFPETRRASRDALPPGEAALPNEGTAPTAEAPVAVVTPPQPAAEDRQAASSVRCPTLLIDKPVRAGQRIYAEGGDLVVLASVNAGAELIADGNIHVYAPLRGRALAGARGDASARIFAQCMEAELVGIAGYFQIFEEPIPEPLRGKPVQVVLDGEQIAMHALAPTRPV